MLNIKEWINKHTNKNSNLQKDIDPQELENKVNEQVEQGIKSLWIVDSMQRKLPQYSNKDENSIFCATWNVNNKKLSDKVEENEEAPSLHKWLLPENKPVCDIYAIGFQEIVDLNALNVVLDGSNTSEMTSYWQNQIEMCLNKDNTGYKYSLVAEEHLVGMLLFVYAKIKVRQNIKDIRTTNCGIGILGVLGNKGSAAIRFKLSDTSFCFVCTHLRASQNQVIGRNEDFHMLLDKTIFPALYHTGDLNTPNLTRTHRPSNQWSISDYYIDKKILNHDYVYWVGDLNYRIDTNEEFTKDKLFEYSPNDHHLLLGQDQLNQERKLGRVFENFNEGEINFPPTYKYVPGTDIYHPPTDKKVR
jgi:phosphatidylinositol-bisphosphatase